MENEHHVFGRSAVLFPGSLGHDGFWDFSSSDRIGAFVFFGIGSDRFLGQQVAMSFVSLFAILPSTFLVDRMFR